MMTQALYTLTKADFDHYYKLYCNASGLSLPPNWHFVLGGPQHVTIDLYLLYQSVVSRGGILSDAPDSDWQALSQSSVVGDGAGAGAGSLMAVRQVYQARIRGFLHFMADLVRQYEIAKREGSIARRQQQQQQQRQHQRQRQQQQHQQVAALQQLEDAGHSGNFGEDGQYAHEQLWPMQQQRRFGSAGGAASQELDRRPVSHRPAGGKSHKAGPAAPAPPGAAKPSSLASRPAARSPAPEVQDPVPGDRLRSVLAWLRGASLGLAEKPYDGATAANAALSRRYKPALARLAAAACAPLPVELYPLFGAKAPAPPRRSGRTRAQTAAARGSSEEPDAASEEDEAELGVIRVGPHAQADIPEYQARRSRRHAPSEMEALRLAARPILCPGDGSKPPGGGGGGSKAAGGGAKSSSTATRASVQYQNMGRAMVKGYAAKDPQASYSGWAQGMAKLGSEQQRQDLLKGALAQLDEEMGLERVQLLGLSKLGCKLRAEWNEADETLFAMGMLWFRRPNKSVQRRYLPHKNLHQLQSYYYNVWKLRGTPLADLYYETEPYQRKTATDRKLERQEAEKRADAYENKVKKLLAAAQIKLGIPVTNVAGKGTPPPGGGGGKKGDKGGSKSSAGKAAAAAAAAAAGGGKVPANGAGAAGDASKGAVAAGKRPASAAGEDSSSKGGGADGSASKKPKTAGPPPPPPALPSRKSARLAPRREASEAAAAAAAAEAAEAAAAGAASSAAGSPEAEAGGVATRRVPAGQASDATAAAAMPATNGVGAADGTSSPAAAGEAAARAAAAPVPAAAPAAEAAPGAAAAAAAAQAATAAPAATPPQGNGVESGKKPKAALASRKPKLVAAAKATKASATNLEASHDKAGPPVDGGAASTSPATATADAPSSATGGSGSASASGGRRSGRVSGTAASGVANCGGAPGAAAVAAVAAAAAAAATPASAAAAATPPAAVAAAAADSRRSYSGSYSRLNDWDVRGTKLTPAQLLANDRRALRKVLGWLTGAARDPLTAPPRYNPAVQLPRVLRARQRQVCGCQEEWKLLLERETAAGRQGAGGCASAGSQQQKQEAPAAAPAAPAPAAVGEGTGAAVRGSPAVAAAQPARALPTRQSKRQRRELSAGVVGPP